MPWFKIDDKFHSHKKTSRCGLGAVGMWSVMGSWCADQLTDGFCPDYVVREKGGRGWKRLADELVEVGYWDLAECDGDKGWRFHDWDVYNPTRDEVLQGREREAEKKRKQRERGSNNVVHDTSGRFMSPGDSPGDSRGVSTATRPDPTRPLNTPPTPLKGGARRRRAVDPDPDPWDVYPTEPPPDPTDARPMWEILEEQA